MHLPGRKNPIPYLCTGDDTFSLSSLSPKEPDFRETYFSTMDSPEWAAYHKMSLISWQTTGEYLEDHSILNPKGLSRYTSCNYPSELA